MRLPKRMFESSRSKSLPGKIPMLLPSRNVSVPLPLYPHPASAASTFTASTSTSSSSSLM